MNSLKYVVMIKTKFIAIALISVVILALSGCEKEEFIVRIENGELVVLEEPYTHPYASDITIKALLLVENDTLPDFPDGLVFAYHISGFLPLGYHAGDTVTVQATLKEIYPKGISNTEANNVNVYKIKDIERIK